MSLLTLELYISTGGLCKAKPHHAQRLYPLVTSSVIPCAACSGWYVADRHERNILGLGGRPNRIMMLTILQKVVIWNMYCMVHSDPVWQWDAVAAERNNAAKVYREGNGSLWFYHNQKAAGTTICKTLNKLEKPGGYYKACYVGGKGKHSFCAANLWAMGQKEALKPHHICTHDYPHDDYTNVPKTLVFEKPDVFLNGTANVHDIVSHVHQIQHLKQLYNQKFVSSEEFFIPRSVLVSWLIHREPQVVAAFESWNFLFNIRHPVLRLHSAFKFHTLWFKECDGNFSHCLTTPLFTRGTHRNRLVKQLSGFFAACEMGGNSVSYSSISPYTDCQAVEATQDDLSLAKLVVHRFLPAVVATDPGDGTVDRDNIFGESMHNIGTILNISLPKKYDHLNVAKKKIKISCDDFNTAAELNALDMQLYEYVIMSLGLRNASYVDGSMSACEVK